MGEFLRFLSWPTQWGGKSLAKPSTHLMEALKRRQFTALQVILAESTAWQYALAAIPWYQARSPHSLFLVELRRNRLRLLPSLRQV